MWRARRTSRVRVRALRPRRVLVLCYGNIYRSPFVSEALRSGALPHGLVVRSAGFHPKPERQTPAAFVAIAAEHGVMLDAHRSRVIDRELVEWAEAIVIMDRHNWDALRAFGAAAVAKAVWLGAFLDAGSVEITDPYGTDAAVMRPIAARLHAATSGLRSALNDAARERAALPHASAP